MDTNADQVAEGTGAAPNAEVQDATGAEDTSFALPEDFEQLTDELPGEQPGEETAEGGEAARPATTQQRGAQQPQVGQQQKPAASPAVQPKAAAPPQQQAVQQPVQRQQDAAAAPQGRLSAGQIVERLAANKDAILGELAGGRFKVELSKAETDALESDAVGTLPKILSRIASQVFYEATIMSMSQIQNLVPHMTQGMMDANVAHMGAENAFFARYTNLDRSDENHVRTVQQFANFYRQQNPRATQSEAIDAVGKAVSAFLGLPLPQSNQQRGASAARPGSRPFAPAGGGRVAQRVPNGGGAPPDPFHGMGMNFDD